MLTIGETVKTGPQGRVHAYPYIVEHPTGPPRTKEQIQTSARSATPRKPVSIYMYIKDKCTIHLCLCVAMSITCTYMQVVGVKGPSWLSTIPSFDIIRGMSFDYMHCVLLVVCRLLLRLWFDSKYHQNVWYIGHAVKDVDDRLRSIRPPAEIQRTPRSIEHTVKFWKGR